jgi:hypothetical protein
MAVERDHIFPDVQLLPTSSGELAHTKKPDPGHREQGDDIDNILFCQESEFVRRQTRLKDLWQCHLDCRVLFPSFSIRI